MNIIDNINTTTFGFLPDGTAVFCYQIENKNGLKLTLTSFGAAITSLQIPLSNQNLVDVVLGFNDLESYQNSFKLQSPPYFGATVGRYAGRIKNGTFDLNGNRFELPRNKGNHTLHGGHQGLSQKNWDVVKISTLKNPIITFSYKSPDLEENFPGALAIELTYTLSENNELIIEYKAISDADTIVNLTNHSYFNLEGQHESVLDHDLYINSTRTLETCTENIPTGRFNKVSYCPFDFSLPKKCPAAIDTSFIIDKKTALAASLFSAKNNLTLEVYTNQPAVHIYVGGNCFGTIKGKENANYHSKSGICFETQNFPDAPNHKHFPNAVLKKGETYHHRTIYKFLVNK